MIENKDFGLINKLVEIEKIEDGTVFLKNGGIRKILLVSGLNFVLKSEEEQQIALFSFQNFLNSLDFPVQINISSRKLKIDEYLKNLEKREGEEEEELLKIQISEYRNFIKNFVSQNAIMDKAFFVIIPYDPIVLPSVPLIGKKISMAKEQPKKEDSKKKEDLDAQLIKLNQRVEQTIIGIRQMGLRSVLLQDDEILNLFKNFYSPALSSSFSDFESIIPNEILINPNYLKIDNFFVKNLFILNYPRYLFGGWLSSLTNLPEIMDISIHISPTDTSIALKNLRQKSAEIGVQIDETQKQSKVRDPMLETALQDIENLRDSLQQAQEKLFSVGLYISIYAENLEKLNSLEERIIKVMESQLVTVKSPIFEQLKAFNSILPTGYDKLNIRHPFNSSPLSSFFPFASVDLTSDNGILYGVNLHNNTLIIFDRFSLENANTVIFAKAGAGKSLRHNQQVLIKQNGEIKLTKIGDLIEKTIKKFGAVQIDEELEGVVDPGIEVFSFNKTLKGEWSKVTVAARKTAPKDFYKFKTRSGREITTTGDHNMLILKNGQVMAAKSSEIKEGEFVPLPRNIQETSQPTQSLNLLEILKNSKNIYLQGAENLIKENYRILKNAGIDKRLDNYLYQYRDSRSMPIWYFLKILKYLGIKLDDPLLEKLEIVSQNGKSKYSLSINFSISNQLLRLLGYIAAEGTIREDVVIISNNDQEILNDIDYLLSNLKIPFYYGNRGIIIASRVFIEIIKALGGSGKSKDKKVPPIIFNLEKEKIAQYLSAYFEGDGGVEKHQVTATSKSPQLISEISYLLYYFGIIARISKTKKKTPQWRQKKTYYQLSISGQDNLRKFAENINFISQRKKQLLSEVITKEGNTNIDVVPEIKEIFNEIYELFSSQLYGIPEISEWKRGVRNPSPQHLQKVINKIEERIEIFKNLAPTFIPLNNLPALNSIVDIGKNNKGLNRALWQVLGQNWRLMKNQEIKPGATNVFKKAIHQGFKEMNLPIKYFNHSLQSALVDRPESNTSYKTIQEAAQFVWQNYQEILTDKISQVEAKLMQLKTLANADLFWDPIVEIEKTANQKEKYVYDLTVNNEVFLAGQGGMFVHNSYAAKLEIIRSLILGSDVLIIDPENEYQLLTEYLNGTMVKISLNSKHSINPMDIPLILEDEDPGEILKSHFVNLAGLLKIMLGEISPREEALIDRAITEAYALKDITTDSNFENLEPPLLKDLEDVLANMEGGKTMADKLYRFTTGSYAGFTNKPTNVDIDNRLIVFSVRDLEEELRPIAMYIILNFIWTKIKSQLKKRIVVVDEAWWLMKYQDSAAFLFSLAKRARKYYLGVTTITQDVEDFLNSPYGRPIITNSSLQLLLKQSPSTIDATAKTFGLSEAEKNYLLEAGVGQGLFLAGLKHAAIYIKASDLENYIITTDPAELAKRKELEKLTAEENINDTDKVEEN